MNSVIRNVNITVPARSAVADARTLAEMFRTRVATLMFNSAGYVCADQAALSLGLAIVPMHTTDNPGNLAANDPSSPQNCQLTCIILNLIYDARIL